MQFRVWLDLDKQGFTVVLPLVIDKADHRNTAVPLGTFGLIALAPVANIAYAKFERFPTQDEYSPSWRLLREIIETKELGPIARPIPLAARSIEAWHRLGRDGDGIVEVVRSEKKGYRFVRNAETESNENALNKGDLLKVVGGAFAGFTAVCQSENSARNELDAIINVFGRDTLTTNIPRAFVERVP
jgi:hypothetical protein